MKSIMNYKSTQMNAITLYAFELFPQQAHFSYFVLYSNTNSLQTKLMSGLKPL